MSRDSFARGRRCGYLWFALGMSLLAGCTFLPRGTATVRHEAIRAGRAFLRPPAQRHLPTLSAVPTAPELVHRALLNSPDVEAAYWRWRAAIEVIAQRGTEASAPALGATVGLKNGQASSASTMVQLANMSSAPLEWPSKPLTEARAALQRAYAAGWRYRRAQFLARRQVLDAWYTLIADSATLRLLRRDANLLAEREAFVHARIQAGIASPDEALTLANEHTEVNARSVAVAARLPEDLATLNRVLGRPARRRLGIPDELPRASPVVAERWRVVARAVRRNPELAALQRDVRADRIDIERAQMNYIPDFSLSAATSLDGITQDLGAAVMFPFVRYRAIGAAIDQSRARLAQTQARLRGRRLSVVARLVGDLAMCRGDSTQIELYRNVLLPRLTQQAAFAAAGVAQHTIQADAPIRIERLRVRVLEALIALRLDEVKRLADIDALSATKIPGAP